MPSEDRERDWQIGKVHRKVDAMERMMQGKAVSVAGFTVAREDCLRRMTWGHAVDQLMQVIETCAA